MRCLKISLTLGCLFLASGATQLEAQASAARAARITTILSVQVPSIVKLVVDPSVLGADGRPVIRVVTNDPTVRALAASGIAPELIRRAQDADGLELRGKGGEAVRGSTVEPAVVRYTIARP